MKIIYHMRSGSVMSARLDEEKLLFMRTLSDLLREGGCLVEVGENRYLNLNEVEYIELEEEAGQIWT